MMQEEQATYYRERAEEIQRKIVNYKSCCTASSESFIWTYRTTSVDVISLITTIVAIRRGAMEDILLKPREVKRIKPSSKNKRAPQLGDSPFDSIMSIDVKARKKKLNQILLSEKNRFMHRLHSTRSWRVQLETKAAMRIQALFRGHSVRMNAADLRQSSTISKQVRSNIRSYLASQHNIHVSLSKYKNALSRLRNVSVVTIQTAYYRYLSRKYLRRRRHEAMLKRRVSSAVRIQSLVRGVAARERVRLFVERSRMIAVTGAVLKMQTLARKHLARRRVRVRRLKLHHYASRLIQDWYRARFARKMATNIKAMLMFRKNRDGAIAMQGIVRRFLAKRRVDRIRLRRLYVVLFKCTTMIQCLVRRFIARVKVPRRRVLLNAAKKEKAMVLAQQLAREASEKELTEQRSLLEGADLFLQARLGHVAAVEDIYSGLASADEHDPSEVDPSTGETLLSLAAQLGNLELVRKCLQWGFDMNYRNTSGLTVFMVAAKYNQLSVMKYLLAPPLDADDGIEVIPLETPLSEEDFGFLLVTAAANASLDDSMQMLKLVLGLEGVNVDFRNAVTGMTALHAACEVGHVEAFKLLLKEKADMEVEDDLSQTVLHKASATSYKITELILGLDPNFPTYMSDQTRFEMTTKLDGDGKDCILHAALNGQTETMELLVGIARKGMMENSKGASMKGSMRRGLSSKQSSNLSGDQQSDINWSSADIGKAMLLVEKGNLLCLEKLAEIGLDFSWSEEETGRTMAIAACQSGDLDMIDLVMSHGADMSVADHSGRTAVHYAALCSDKQEGMIAHLLTHEHAAKCKVSEKCLVATDKEGENVYHLSVRANVLLNIDLLAQSALSEALEMKNKAGLTPLLLACSLYRLELVKGLLLIGADALQVDSNRHGCMWHVFHPQVAAIPAGHRSVCSEFKRHHTPNLSRREVDAEVARVGSEVAVIQALLKSGCALYDDYRVTPDDIMTLKPKIDDLEVDKHMYQPGDIAVHELSFTLFRSILSSGLVTKSDAWRLLISAIWFDDGSLKMLSSLLKDGLLEVLLLDEEVESAISGTDGTSKDAVSMWKLQRVYCAGLTAAGWAIRLHRPHVLKFAVRKPYDLTAPVDIYGNPALHLIAMYGTAEMVDIVLSDKATRIELSNVQGLTAGMVAARYKNLEVLHNLFHRGADVRRWLGAGCAAWVLAFVRRKERFEKNLQTGRCGDDDDRYFGLGADPFYSMWYDPTS